MDQDTFLLFNEKHKENSDFDDLFETRHHERGLGYLVRNLCKYCGPLEIYPFFDQKVEIEIQKG